MRDTSEPWSLSLPGVAQNRTWSEPPGRETKGPTLGGEVPHGLPSTLTQGPRGPPSILTGSLSVAPSFFTCGKKTSCETPGRRLGHQVLKEALVMGPREVSRTVATDPGQDGKPEGNACAGKGPTPLLQVCPWQVPSPCTCGCGSQVPSTWTIRVTSLSLTSHGHGSKQSVWQTGPHVWQARDEHDASL